MAVSLSLSITQNSQSTANNTSNVTVKVTASWTYGSYNAADCSGWLKIDGTKYTFSEPFNTGGTTSGSAVIFTKTVDVSHNSDGTKTLSCSASYATDVSSGTITASKSKTLTKIPRKSTLSVSNGTLGTAQTLTITEKASAFYHKIKYTCGSVTGWALGTDSAPSSTLSFSWTPPMSLAEQNTSGTTVSVKFTLYTYKNDSNDGLIGSVEYTRSFTIPVHNSLKSSVSVEVSDPRGYYSTFGKYIKGKSAIQVVVTASGKQGATIESIVTKANGATYKGSTVVTGVVKSVGTNTITVTVTDSRGMVSAVSKNITVEDYTAPKISALSVIRCNSDGTANNNGAYLKATFSAQITSLDSKNTATYKIAYKKSSETSYGTAAAVTSYGSGTKYNVVNGTYIFAADTSTGYDVKLTAADAFSSADKVAAGSSLFKLFSIFNDRKGWAFGKIADLSGYLDVNLLARFRKAATFDSTIEVSGQVKSTNGGGSQFLATNTTDGTRTAFRARKITSAGGITADCFFGVGVNGVDHGVYSEHYGKWLIHSDGSKAYLVGKSVERESVEITGLPEGSAYSCYYYPLLGICLLRLYFTGKAASAATATLLGTVSTHKPSTFHALAVSTSQDYSKAHQARINSSGQIYFIPEVEKAATDASYITGFWFC